jgi:hypothetical protein
VTFNFIDLRTQTMNTTCNPLLKATRAAFAELTTSEAQLWYSTQAKATAARASAIATGIGTISRLSITTATRLLQRKPVLASLEQVEITDARGEAIAPAEASAESVQDEDTTELRPWTISSQEQTEAAIEPVQASTSTEVSSEAADLGQEHTPPVWAATEVNDHETASAEDEGIEDGLALTIVTGDEPLPDSKIPFDEELECAPPFLEEEEDTSFFSPEEEEPTNDLLNEDIDPNSFLPPSDLSAMIQAYMRQNSVSAESSDEDASAQPSAAPDSTDGAAAFAWEEHQVASDRTSRE